MGRGFLLSQAIERWQARAIWVVSRADADYPRRLKTRLKDDAPPILYGCGDAAILDTGGLAVVGSRHVDDALVEYTEGIGRLAARARRTLVSGGARGIDQAAMRGALEAGGKVAGVLADSLERTALNREHRNFLMDGQLVLISPYDPSAGFNVGHAMQRNKLIYALADAALVVNSDYREGRHVDRRRRATGKAAARACLCPLERGNRQGVGGPPTQGRIALAQSGDAGGPSGGARGCRRVRGKLLPNKTRLFSRFARNPSRPMISRRVCPEQ